MTNKTVTHLAIAGGFALLLSMNIADVDKRYVAFGENLLVSKYELTNGEYKVFLHDLKEQKELEKLEISLPDSSLWVTGSYNYAEPLKNMYHWHPSWDNYPVVNISKQAIEYYCEWLTDKYNATIRLTHKKVKFRLPTESEWKLFSAPLPDHNLPWPGNFPYTIGRKGEIEPLANLKVRDYSRDDYNYVWDEAMFTATVGSFPGNRLGLFDIIGNVAEYTSDDKVKGGSWADTLEESAIDKVQNYDIPDPRVGFRLVMEIVEE